MPSATPNVLSESITAEDQAQPRTRFSTFFGGTDQMLVAARRGEMVQQHSARQSAAVEAGKAVGQKVAEFVIGPWARIRAAQVETSRHVEGWP